MSNLYQNYSNIEGKSILELVDMFGDKLIATNKRDAPGSCTNRIIISPRVEEEQGMIINDPGELNNQSNILYYRRGLKT